MSLSRIRRAWPRFATWLAVVRGSWRTTVVPYWRVLSQPSAVAAVADHVRSRWLVCTVHGRAKLERRRSLFEVVEPRQLLTIHFQLVDFVTDSGDLRQWQVDYDFTGPGHPSTLSIDIYRF